VTRDEKAAATTTAGAAAPAAEPVVSSGVEAAAVPRQVNDYHDFISYLDLQSPDIGWKDYIFKSVEFGFEAMQFYTGLPWWAVFAAVPFIVRTVLLPIYFNSMANSARMQAAAPEVKEFQMKHGLLQQQGKANMADYYPKINEIYKKHNASFWGGLRNAALQMPVFVLMFFTIRDMCLSPQWHEILSQGGISWFTDLTVADPYYVLPGLSAFGLWLMLVSNDLFPF